MLAIAACDDAGSDGSALPDSAALDAAIDTAVAPDASTNDAGEPDTGPVDAAMDSTLEDAEVDTGSEDAQPFDATTDTTVDAAPHDSGSQVSEGIWIGPDEVRALPMSGAAWDQLAAAATGSWGSADVSNQDNDHDVYTFAGALVAVRTDDNAMRDSGSCGD